MDMEANMVEQHDQQFEKLAVMPAKSKTALEDKGDDSDDDFASPRRCSRSFRFGHPRERERDRYPRGRSCKDSGASEAGSRPKRDKTAASGKVGVGLNGSQRRQRAAREMAAADRCTALAELTLTVLQAHEIALTVSSATIAKTVAMDIRWAYLGDDFYMMSDTAEKTKAEMEKRSLSRIKVASQSVSLLDPVARALQDKDPHFWQPKCFAQATDDACDDGVFVSPAFALLLAAKCLMAIHQQQ